MAEAERASGNPDEPAKRLNQACGGEPAARRPIVHGCSCTAFVSSGNLCGDAPNFPNEPRSNGTQTESQLATDRSLALEFADSNLFRMRSVDLHGSAIDE